jgi:two-component system, chemotaxis family, CheB/CheR fusion protein
MSGSRSVIVRKDSGGPSPRKRRRAERQPPVATQDFHVVGVGASAGGLESLERLFSRLAPDTGMAFVVLQHLSPDFKTLMDELLARRTSMPVHLADHDVEVAPNTVYLLPPNKEMIIKGRRLLLSDKEPRQGLALPIDVFLRSLAQDVGERAIAVILSGSGSDGSRGIQEVHRAGGLVFCESSDTAKFTGMPTSALKTGVVDQSLSPEDIAAVISGIGKPSLAHEPSRPVPRLGVDAVLQLLHDEYGIDFSHYKATTVERRIERRLSLNRSLNLEAYLEQLRTDPRELNSLYEDLLIGVTRFFRDDDAFSVLAERVIGELVERSAPNEQIRVWVPGCATGQEAYSMAMLLFEALTSRDRPVNVKILASDVHKASLTYASAGLYPEEQLAGISQTRMDRFFTRKPAGFQISQDLRDLIVFCPHNLLRDAPFTRMDMISCRNLLIYFQPHAQKTVLTLFHFCLKPRGVLFLGSSESPGGLVDEFDVIDEHAKIFRKRRDIALPRDLKLPLARPGAPPRLYPPPTAANANAGLLTLYDRLLDQFMPAGFLVQADGELVDTFGGAETLLKPKPRRPSQNILEMLSDDLRTLVSGTIHRLRRDVTPVRFTNVRVEGLDKPVAVAATPVADASGTLTHAFIAIHQDGVRADGVGTAAAPATTTYEDVAQTHTTALLSELAFTKENLQATIQELETTNEELQATNEELMASNEELQSTNEELHSVNEELYTVNAEYQKKNAELQELNDDFEHLLDRTDVGTMFLDRDLCIRKFTPRIADTFDILPQDIGRPLRTFHHRLTHDTLLQDVERVSRDGVTVETQTWDDRGRCYFLRILRYRARRPEPQHAIATAVDRPLASDGVVITLTEISALEQARSKLAELSAIVKSSDDAIIGHSLDGTVTSWNAGATRLFGHDEVEAVGQHVSALYPVALRANLERFIKKIKEGAPVDRLDTIETMASGRTEVSVTFSPIRDGAGKAVGVSAIARDITALVSARRELSEREERIRLLLDSTAEAIYGIDLSGVCTFCNVACARMVGADSPAALIGRQVHSLIHHSHPDGSPYPAERSPIYDAMRNHVEAHVDSEVIWRLDGTHFPAEYWAHPIHRDGQVLGAVITFIDITERKRAEREIQEGVRRREQFLAMLSHELRNPLSAVLNAAELLRMPGTDIGIQDRAANVIARQGRHMARLLDDLLDVSRITRGRITLHRELVDLREASRAALESAAPLVQERKITLVVSLPEQPLVVDGDPARLQQIQANLLSNAVKYSPPGSTVHFTVSRDRNEAVVRVRDRGRGIEPEVLPRIFELFVQGQQSIERPEGGLGIGLTLLRALVDLHGGHVSASSDGRDRGSEFVVRLPLARAAATAMPGGQAAPARAVRTVVVVEDQDDARQMLSMLLESRGLEVSVAADGIDGAELIERLQPDLALVDLGLPRLDGYSVARRVRAANPHVCLVALTGYGQDADVRAALEAGFDEHLTKPADPDQLDAVLTGRSAGLETKLEDKDRHAAIGESGEWSVT